MMRFVLVIALSTVTAAPVAIMAAPWVGWLYWLGVRLRNRAAIDADISRRDRASYERRP